MTAFEKKVADIQNKYHAQATITDNTCTYTDESGLKHVVVKNTIGSGYTTTVYNTLTDDGEVRLYSSRHNSWYKNKNTVNTNETFVDKFCKLFGIFSSNKEYDCDAKGCKISNLIKNAVHFKEAREEEQMRAVENRLKNSENLTNFQINIGKRSLAACRQAMIEANNNEKQKENVLGIYESVLDKCVIIKKPDNRATIRDAAKKEDEHVERFFLGKIDSNYKKSQTAFFQSKREKSTFKIELYSEILNLGAVYGDEVKPCSVNALRNKCRSEFGSTSAYTRQVAPSRRQRTR